MDFEYKFNSSGFFGYGAEGDFTYWSLAHFAPIIITILGILLVYRFRNKILNWKHEETFRFFLAGILIFCEAFYYWRIRRFFINVVLIFFFGFNRFHYY